MTEIPLPCPREIKKKLPLRREQMDLVLLQRTEIQKALLKEIPAKLLIVGPCSLHDSQASLEFAKELAQLQAEMSPYFLLIMRSCFEKPRTTIGWKGLIYEPAIGTPLNMLEGILTTRQLFLSLLNEGIALAAEIVNPLFFPYFDDLLAYVWIGARTSSSQIHREFASSVEIPVGFKNSVTGDLLPALEGAFTANQSHNYAGLNQEGKASLFSSKGNPLAHIILRGGESHPNYTPQEVVHALSLLRSYPILQRVIIDCSHGNSKRDPEKQKSAFVSVMEQIVEGNASIAGVMLESHLYGGNQKASPPLQYGVSITDPCLGIEEIKILLKKGYELLCQNLDLQTLRSW